jgi:hypothetical protein
MVSGISATAGKKAASQIEKETLKKRITNIEVRYSINIIFEKKTERSDSTLHHSKFLVRYSAVRSSNYV